jgi:putative SOS response-associated peptidase YedK
MCGRYSLHTPPEEILEHFELSVLPQWEPRYNVAPTQDVPVVRQEDGDRALSTVRWGLIPFGAEALPSGPPLINARSETVDTRPSFRWAFRRNRCLVAADGFYEWKKVGAQRYPYFLAKTDGGLFAFAGVWDRWAPREGDPVETCAILTTEPNAVAKQLHDRMPVILDPAAYQRWLDPEADLAALRDLLVPFDANQMTAYPVGRAVNKVENDGPECIERAEAPRAPIELDLFDDV